MKSILALLLFSAFLSSCSNEHKEARQKELREFVKDTSNYTTVKWIDTAFDLGTINSGDVKELKYKFLNTGNKPLLLGNVTAGCGCTVPSFSKDRIMPGEEGFITAHFNSKKQCDDVVKYINVPSNDKADTIRVLSFKAHIVNCESNDKVVPRKDVKEE